MTDLTIFSDTEYDDKSAWEDFLLANSMAHAVTAKTFEQLGHTPQFYPMTSFENEKDWLAFHNDVHQSEFAILGFTSMPDLSDVDLTNKEEYADWMNQHSLIHMYINQILNITT